MLKNKNIENFMITVLKIYTIISFSGLLYNLFIDVDKQAMDMLSIHLEKDVQSYTESIIAICIMFIFDYMLKLVNKGIFNQCMTSLLLTCVSIACFMYLKNFDDEYLIFHT